MGVGDEDDAGATAGLSRNIRIVSLVSFFQDTASELLYPVLPFFVTGVLGAPPAILGLIEGVADGTASAMRAVSGRLAPLAALRLLRIRSFAVSCAGNFDPGSRSYDKRVVVYARWDLAA